MRKHFTKGSRTISSDQEKDSDQKTHVTDTVHDKRLLRRIPIIQVLEPITYQQVRTQPHTFPSDKEDDKVRTQHQQQHRKHKEVQIGEITRKMRPLLIMHIGSRIKMYQETNPRYDKEEKRRQLI